MLTRHVALVSDESSITMRELSLVAAALQKQATRDLGPLWKIEATVTAFEKLEDLPLDYWPVVIKDDIGQPDAAGYHDDQHGQPFALIQYSDGWTLTASHEVLEMLVDPFGRRLVAGQSPAAKQGRVRFLVEVCDPSEADAYAYKVNGIKVSDFYTPHFMDPGTSPGVRYSYTGAITAPRQVLRGGYLSWYDSASGKWWQRTYFGAKPADRQISKLKVVNGNLRSALDRLTEPERARAMKRPSGSAGVAATQGMAMRMSALHVPVPSFPERAKSLRAAIRAVTRKGKS